MSFNDFSQVATGNSPYGFQCRLAGGDDSGEWDIYPEENAILIGTQDMLLSRALNRGYGMSRYRWPLHFGLLNNGCLWVMDETQLMGPGLGTACQLEAFRNAAPQGFHSFGASDSVTTWYMSATSNPEILKTREWREVPRPGAFEFGLDPAERAATAGPIHQRRFAVKHLELQPTAGFVDSATSRELAAMVLERHREMVAAIAGNPTLPARTLVICNTVNRAEAVWVVGLRHRQVERVLMVANGILGAVFGMAEQGEARRAVAIHFAEMMIGGVAECFTQRHDEPGIQQQEITTLGHLFSNLFSKQCMNGHLSDLHVWCPYGFTQAEVEVLMRVQRLNWGSGKYPVRPVLTALSKAPPADAPFATVKSPPARLWRSASPFVPPRYFFRRERGKVTAKEDDRPERQLAECLKAVGIKGAGEIRRLPQGVPGSESGWDIVRTPEGDDPLLTDTTTIAVHCNGASRSRSRQEERRVGLFLEIGFNEPITLPVPALGHSCHFGPGLFVPVAD